MQFAAEMHSDCRARLLSRSTFNFLESRTERGSFVGSNNAKGWHDIGLGSSGAVAVIEFGNIQRTSEMFDLCLVPLNDWLKHGRIYLFKNRRPADAWSFVGEIVGGQKMRCLFLLGVVGVFHCPIF